jgi:hypothetical protein
MDFDLVSAVPMLERTPLVLRSLLCGLPDQWAHADDGAGTWSVREVLAHSIHGETADWIPRAHHLMEWGDRKPFPPFGRTFGFAERRDVTTSAPPRGSLALVRVFARARC